MTRALGEALAEQVALLSADPSLRAVLLTGVEAAAIGLANRAVAADQALSIAQELAQEVAACAPLAVRGVKRALERSLGASLEDQLSFEASEQAVCFESADVQEGISAAAERRDPVFRGR